MRDAVHFTDPEGIVYRVLGSAWHGEKQYSVDRPAPWATTRIFRPALNR
jgi:hypothetical protein